MNKLITINASDRYKRVNGEVVIEIAVKNSRQLFNERDPSPFRERDLDENFVTYIVNAVQEFPLQTKMKIQIVSSDNTDTSTEKKFIISEAIQTYFQYESKLASAKLRKRLKMARLFSLIGVSVLIVSLSIAEAINSLKSNSAIANVASVGLVIIGWVAMWHPIEVLLYDWWPDREQRMYFDKIAKLNVDVINANVN